MAVPTLWGYLEKPKPSSSVTSEMKERVVKSAEEFIARDLRPFKAIARQGLEDTGIVLP